MVQKVNLSMTEDIAEEINDVSVAVNAVADDLAALDDSLGTASERNVGDGAGLVPDKAVLDARLGTSGSLGTAATKNFGTSAGDLPVLVASDDVLIDSGDFSGSPFTLYLRKIGDIVVASTKDFISHAADSFPNSSSLAPEIPSAYRPPQMVENVYLVNNLASYSVQIHPAGWIRLRYVAPDGSPYNSTSSLSAVNIVYTV